MQSPIISRNLSSISRGDYGRLPMLPMLEKRERGLLTRVPAHLRYDATLFTYSVRSPSVHGSVIFRLSELITVLVLGVLTHKYLGVCTHESGYKLLGTPVGKPAMAGTSLPLSLDHLRSSWLRCTGPPALKSTGRGAWTAQSLLPRSLVRSRTRTG